MWFGKKSIPDWRDSFVGVTRQAFRNEGLSFEESAVAIRNGSGKQLLEFDLRARGKFSGYLQHSGSRPSAVLRIALSNPTDADVFLFYGSCDGNGYIREQALRALRGHDCRLACAAALIRADDWVPEVRDISTRLLEDFAASGAGCHFFGLLDLIVKLQSRQRFKPQWATTFEPLLLAPKWRKARHAAVSSAQAVARRMAHELILRADTDLSASTLRQAISDPTALVAIWALAHLRESVSAQEARELLREGLQSRLASVRSESLRRYCRATFDDVRDVLQVALFDRSRSVRGVASYQLREIHGESALDSWRKAFDEGRRDIVTMTALADFGDATDDARLRTYLTHPRGRIRALALHGLVRIGAGDTDSLLAAGLRDGASQVVSTTIAAHAHGVGNLDLENLHRAFTSTSSPNIRLRLISASRCLRKWERLEFLLLRYGDCAGLELEHLDHAVQAWICGANRSYAALGPERRGLILKALEAARHRRPSTQWNQVQHLL